MIGYFGKIIFEVSDKKVLTFNNFTINSAAKFADHALLNQKPKLEFVGNELDTISMSIHLSSNQGLKPKDVIDQLSKYKNDGDAQILVIADNVIGSDKWVIESLSQAWGVVFNNGKLFSANVDVTFKEYIDDSNTVVAQSTAPQVVSMQTSAVIQQPNLSYPPAAATQTPAQSISQTSDSTPTDLGDIPGLIVF